MTAKKLLIYVGNISGDTGSAVANITSQAIGDIAQHKGIEIVSVKGTDTSDIVTMRPAQREEFGAIIMIGMDPDVSDEAISDREVLFAGNYLAASKSLDGLTKLQGLGEADLYFLSLMNSKQASVVEDSFGESKSKIDFVDLLELNYSDFIDSLKAKLAERKK